MDTSLALWRRALAEGIGAFCLVLFGCGAIVADARGDGLLGPVGIALAFGLVILAMVAATGHLSGAHLNPAVTVAFALSRHFPARDVAAYVAGQLAGGMLAALCLLLVWPGSQASWARRCPAWAPRAQSPTRSP